MLLGHLFCTELSCLLVFGQLEQNIAIPPPKNNSRKQRLAHMGLVHPVSPRSARQEGEEEDKGWLHQAWSQRCPPAPAGISALLELS